MGRRPLQTAVRRIVLWSPLRSPDGVRAVLDGARLQFRFPTRIAAVPLVAWPVLAMDAALTAPGRRPCAQRSLTFP